MTEALQTRLRSSSSYLELYLRGAQLKAILRDTDTVGSEGLVLVPSQLFELLLGRLMEIGLSSEMARYLAHRASPAFLRFVGQSAADTLDKLLVIEPIPGDPNYAVELGCRLREVGLLTELRLQMLWTSTREAFTQLGAYGFLEATGMQQMFGEERLRTFLAAERNGGFPSLDSLYSWVREAISANDDSAAEELLCLLDQYCLAMIAACSALDILQDDGVRALKDQVQYTAGLLRQEVSDIRDKRAERDEEYYDDYKDTWRDERYELEHGLFSDVDE